MKAHHPGKLSLLPVTLFIMIMSLGLNGCAMRYTVNVNAITNPSLSAPGTKYVLTSAMKDIDEKNLYFQEFSRYFQLVLQKQGYTRVADKTQADMDIQFKFAVSDGRTGIATHSWPIYETVGGEMITITEKTVDSSGNPTTTTRTIRLPARVERVGTSVETRSYTLFNRSAVLEAYQLTKDGNKGEMLWMVQMSSIGESDDLRNLMPYLAAASARFIGANTGQQFQVTLDQKDPLVMELKGTLK